MNELYRLDLLLGDTEVSILISDEVVQKKEEISSKLHFHQYMECHLITKGFCQIGTENNLYTINAGEICIIPALLCHTVKSFSPDVEKCTFMINIKQSKNTTPEIFNSLNYIFTSKNIHVIKDASLYEFFLQNLKSASWSNPIQNLKLKSTFSLLILSFAEHIEKSENPEKNKSDSYDRIYDAESYIQNFYMYDISCRSLSERMHLSERQVNRILKQQSGLCFKELLTRQRMIVAKELLQNPDIKLTDIPAKIGFKSYSGFYYCVKNFWGKTPETIKKNLISSDNH